MLSEGYQRQAITTGVHFAPDSDSINWCCICQPWFDEINLRNVCHIRSGEFHFEFQGPEAKFQVKYRVRDHRSIWRHEHSALACRIYCLPRTRQDSSEAGTRQSIMHHAAYKRSVYRRNHPVHWGAKILDIRLHPHRCCKHCLRSNRGYDVWLLHETIARNSFFQDGEENFRKLSTSHYWLTVELFFQIFISNKTCLITIAYDRYKHDLCYIFTRKYKCTAWMLMTLGVCWI